MTTTDPSQHPKYQAALERKAAAEADDGYALYCFDTDNGKHKVFYLEADQALMPGHIYSADGRSEYKISGYCEQWFDRITVEPEEDELPDDLPYEEMYGECS